MWRAANIIVALLTLLAAPATLAGCGDSAPPADSGIRGTVVLEGGPPEAQGPLAGLTVEAHEGDEAGPLAASCTSDAQGAFRLRVDPGAYTVVALWKDGSRTVAVTVVSGAFATVRIVFRAK